jgi:hypothetical protein
MCAKGSMQINQMVSIFTIGIVYDGFISLFNALI